MKTLISSTEGLLFVILLMVAFSLWLQRYKVFRSLGPVLTVVIIGIVLLNGKYGYVTLEKGGQKLYCTVHNYGAEATTVRNCFVTSLYGDLDTTKIPISITNGITLGTSESDFLAKAGDAKSEKTEKEDSNLTLYTFYSDDEKLDYTEIGIDNDLKLVRSIKVVHNQPEAPEEEAKKTSAEDSSSVSDSQEPSETPAP